MGCSDWQRVKENPTKFSVLTFSQQPLEVLSPPLPVLPMLEGGCWSPLGCPCQVQQCLWRYPKVSAAQDATALSASKYLVTGGKPMSCLCSCKTTVELVWTMSPWRAVPHASLQQEAVQAPLPLLAWPFGCSWTQTSLVMKAVCLFSEHQFNVWKILLQWSLEHFKDSQGEDGCSVGTLHMPGRERHPASFFPLQSCPVWGLTLALGVGRAEVW